MKNYLKKVWAQIVAFWNKTTKKTIIYNESETRVELFRKAMQHLVTARSALKPYKISIQIYYNGTNLKSGKTMMLKVLSEWLKEAEFINDQEAIKTYRDQIEKIKREL